MDLWDEMVERGDGERGKGRWRCAAAWSSITLEQGESLELMVGT